MSFTGHFGREKFKSFLLAGTFASCSAFLNRLVDCAIVGNVIGEDAFAGVSLVAPVQALVSFCAYLIAMGAANNFAIWMGRLDKVRARRFFTLGLVLAVSVGLVLSTLIFFCEGEYFLSLGGSEYVEMYARQYMDWYWPIGLTSCLFLLLGAFCCADGDFHLGAVAQGTVLALNVAISYVAVRSGMGASGCALGSVVAEAVGIAILCGHFFRRVNTLAPVRGFSLTEVRAIVRASFGSAAIFLCHAVLFFALHKLVIAKFDSDLLPVASLAIAVWRFMLVFGGVALAAQPIVAVYWGERNMYAIRKVMQTAMVAAVIEGILLAALFLFFPGLAISVAGVEYPDLIAPSRDCVMLICVALVPLALVRLFGSYFLYVERPVVSLAVTVVGCLALPLAGALVGSRWGLNGIWAGLAAGPYLGFLLFVAANLVRFGRHGFPLMLPFQRKDSVRMFDLVLEPEEIVRVSRLVAGELPPAVASRAALLVEEVFMVVRERNANRSRLLGEVTLDFNDGIVMTLRDDGVIFDITDADAQVSSLRAYLVASVMRCQTERLNLVTSGFNRNVFRLS